MEQQVLFSRSIAKTLLLALLVVICSLPGRAHDGHKAYFTLSAAKNMVEVTIRVHSGEFSNELDDHSDCDIDMDQAVCAIAYFQKNFRVAINGEQTNLLYIATVEQDEYSVYSFGLLIDPVKVRTVDIRNNCFIFSEHKTTSIVDLDLAAKASYKMDRVRTQISHRF